MIKTEKLKTGDLTTGSPLKKILLFSLPLMFSNLLQVLFNISDIAVVGKFGGSQALGSVGSTAIYVGLFTGILIGIGSGVNAVVAKNIGAGNEDAVTRTVHTSAIVCLIIGVLLAALGIGVARPMLVLLGTKQELLDDAVLYVYIYFACLPAAAVYNFGNGVFSADGDTKKPLIILAAAGTVNVGLNLFFVIVCKMSVKGVALASVISQYLSAALIILLLCLSKKAYRLSIKKLKLYKAETKSVLAIGIPTGLQNAIFAAANLFIQAGVNTFDTVMVEGNSAAANADTIIYDISAAFYVACTSFISQNYGAGKRGNILKCYFVSLLYAFLLMLALGVALAFGGRPFLSLFTSDADVIEAGMSKLVVMGFTYCISALMDSAIAASRGLGKSLIPTIMVILGSCVFRIIWVYTVFAYFKTIVSLYLVYVTSWVLTAIAENIYFAIIYRKYVKKIELQNGGCL